MLNTIYKGKYIIITLFLLLIIVSLSKDILFLHEYTRINIKKNIKIRRNTR